jgi:hypothetical protein
MNKEKEIMKFGEWFLSTLSERCLQNCGKSLSVIQYPVFKKFLAHRIKREIQFYKLCLDMASMLVETGTEIAIEEIEEIIEESMELDKRFKRDITFLPLRVNFDYDKIFPLRKSRTERQVNLFARLLRADGADYHQMAKKAFQKNEFFELHNDILELYAEEAFVINQSIKALIDFDAERTSHRVHCSMLDIGFTLDRQLADDIFGEN